MLLVIRQTRNILLLIYYIFDQNQGRSGRGNRESNSVGLTHINWVKSIEMGSGYRLITDWQPGYPSKRSKSTRWFENMCHLGEIAQTKHKSTQIIMFLQLSPRTLNIYQWKNAPKAERNPVDSKDKRRATESARRNHLGPGGSKISPYMVISNFVEACNIRRGL
jgi:hypothetical protein